MNTARDMPCRNTARDMPCMNTARDMPCRNTARDVPCRNTARDMPCRNTARDVPCRNTARDMAPCTGSTRTAAPAAVPCSGGPAAFNRAAGLQAGAHRDMRSVPPRAGSGRHRWRRPPPFFSLASLSLLTRGAHAHTYTHTHTHTHAHTQPHTHTHTHTHAPHVLLQGGAELAGCHPGPAGARLHAAATHAHTHTHAHAHTRTRAWCAPAAAPCSEGPSAPGGPELPLTAALPPRPQQQGARLRGRGEGNRIISSREGDR